MNKEIIKRYFINAMSTETENIEKEPINFKEVKSFFADLVKDFIDLEHDVDKRQTIKEIKMKQSINGPNAWMLMCSIMIASIGLNLNSQAVIIGAMLISPLMSPILGVGLSVAINDKEALYEALMNFGAAIVIALLTSTFYFWLSPLDAYTEQIQVRTSPTFLDILIAIFGGIAGIISITRKDVSTTLPGVAIATALMPPLCVAGYGIANNDWDIASKAFYLFFLNTFFVAFATYLILRRMRFPYKVYATKKVKRKNMIIISLFSLIMIIPSLIIFKNVYGQFSEAERVQKFISIYIGENQIYLDDYMVTEKPDKTKKLFLKVYGDLINDSQLGMFQKGLDSLGLHDMSIRIIPTSDIKLARIKKMETELLEVGERLDLQVELFKEEREQRKNIRFQEKSEWDLLVQDSFKINHVNKLLKILMPNINKIGFANVQFTDEENSIYAVPTAIVNWQSKSLKMNEEIQEYLKIEYNLDTLIIIEN